MIRWTYIRRQESDLEKSEKKEVFRSESCKLFLIDEFFVELDNAFQNKI